MSYLRMLALLILTFLISIDGYSQRKRTTKKKETEKSTVIVFDDEKIDEKDEDYITPEMIIKTNPISFIFGSQIIELERQINDWFSVQVGAGVTFKDRSKSLSFYDELIGDDYDGSPFSNAWESDVTDYYYSQDFDGNDLRKSNLGYAFTLSTRLFYNSDGFEGGYFAPTFTYRRFNFTAQDVVIGETYEQRTGEYTDPENVSYADFTIRYGYNNIYDKLMTESFIGIGLRSASNHRQDVGYESGGYIGKGYQDFKTSELRFELGIRIGLQF